MAIRLQVRRDTSTNWSTNNPILQVGEFGFDTTVNRFKVGIASNETSRWNVLPYLNVIPSELKELAQDFVEEAITAGTGITKTYNDTANTLTISVDSTIANKTYVDTAVSGLSSSSSTTYVPLSLIGNIDGVASLDENAKIPDEEIPSEITRNTLAQTLTNKTIGLGSGITSISAIDNIQGLFGQNNIAIFQAGLDRGGKINISSLGVISIANSGVGYVSGLVTNAGGTRFNITVGGNTLSGTLAEFNAALTDGDFATESYVSTAVSNLIDSAPETLNTLNELAAAINDDASYAATLTTALGTKLNSSTAATTYLSISEPSVDYYVSNAGMGSYMVNGISNGTMYFEKGKKYRIHVNATGHPFWIQTVPLAYSYSNVYNTGITNNGTQNGHIIVELAADAPQLYYACEFHSSMNGSIVTGTTSQTYKSLSNLSNVDNTSDETKALLSYIAVSDSIRTINSSTDKNRLIEFSNACTVTIPNDTQDPGWPVGSMVELRQSGTGQITVTKDAAVTMVGADSQFKSRVQWSTIMLEKRSANSWLITGDTTA